MAFTPKIDNTVLNFLPANQLISAWAIEKKSGAVKASEWLQQQAGIFPSNTIVQWALHNYEKKQDINLLPGPKNGEVRIIEELQTWQH